MTLTLNQPASVWMNIIWSTLWCHSCLLRVATFFPTDRNLAVQRCALCTGDPFVAYHLSNPAKSSLSLRLLLSTLLCPVLAQR